MGAYAAAVPVLAVVVLQQLRARPIRPVGSLVTPAVFGVLGAAGIAFGIASVVKFHPLTALPVVLLGASLAAAAVLGAARAKTVSVWREPGGRVLRRGSVATTGLWLLSFAVHLAFGLWIDHADGVGLLGIASLYAYAAIGLSAQNLLLRRRAAAL
ncbi:hypothetical protein LO763_10925 [Glycomyces sp. A-F 0318]|uniref:hypothetical protein n=1 Tax=Glycomyces amatae TaxID=2881355 RepID=UPI001E4C463D|nr:hypothetical protein [Glycomyces amatae]MCD0444137.1 hypothetical protein [Glycomyces amatae]